MEDADRDTHRRRRPGADGLLQQGIQQFAPVDFGRRKRVPAHALQGGRYGRHEAGDSIAVGHRACLVRDMTRAPGLDGVEFFHVGRDANGEAPRLTCVGEGRFPVRFGHDAKAERPPGCSLAQPLLAEPVSRIADRSDESDQAPAQHAAFFQPLDGFDELENPARTLKRSDEDDLPDICPGCWTGQTGRARAGNMHKPVQVHSQRGR